MKRNHPVQFLLAFTVAAVSACGSGEQTNTPVCNKLASNEDAAAWLDASAQWENSNKNRIILRVDLPESKLLLSADPRSVGGKIDSADKDRFNDMLVVVTPSRDADRIDVLLPLDCDGDPYTVAIRLDTRTETAKIPVTILDPDKTDEPNVSISDGGD